MKSSSRTGKRFFTLVLLGIAGLVTAVADEPLLIDDFSTDVSALGTRWQGFSDRVMGGISDIRAGYVNDDSQNAIRMVGKVSLENNGGFIQVRLPLANRGTFDASEYTGVAVEVKGVSGSYYLHIRTGNSSRPWQYYEAKVDVANEWQRVEIPFSSFESQATRSALNPGRLTSVALVGGKEEFDADVTIRRIEFF